MDAGILAEISDSDSSVNSQQPRLKKKHKKGVRQSSRIASQDIQTSQTTQTKTQTQTPDESEDIHTDNTLTSNNTQDENLRETRLNAASLIVRIKKKIHKILTESSHLFEEETRKNLMFIYQDSRNLQNEIRSNQERTANLENMVQQQEVEKVELREFIVKISEKIPTIHEVKDAVQLALNTHTQQLQEATELTDKILMKFKNLPQTEQMDNLIAQLENNTKHLQEYSEKMNEAPKAQNVQPQRMSQQEYSTKTTTKPNKPYRRSLIVKAIAKNTTGKEIKQMIFEQKFHTDARIAKIETNRYNVEIECASGPDKDKLRSELENNAMLSTILTVTDKPKQLLKAIIPNVDKEITYEQICKSLDSTYYMDTDDIQSLREQTSRIPDCRNIIVLISPQLLLSLVEDNGIQIGFRRFKFLPFTVVQRCRRCQMLHHQEKQCVRDRICENCSTHHEHEEHTTCTKRPHCLNCQTHNTKFKTTFDTRHKTSDSKCEAYRSEYTKERERLNKLFKIETQKVNSTTANRNEGETYQSNGREPPRPNITTSTANSRSSNRIPLPTRFTPLPLSRGVDQNVPKPSVWQSCPQASVQSSQSNTNQPQQQSQVQILSERELFSLFQQFMQHSKFSR